MADSGVKNFGVLLASINGGKVVDEATDKTHNLLDELSGKASLTNQKAKGDILVKLSFTVLPNGLVNVDADVQGKAPKPVREQDAFFLTESGGLSRKNERQQELPLREVLSQPVEMKEAK